MLVQNNSLNMGMKKGNVTENTTQRMFENNYF